MDGYIVKSPNDAVNSTPLVDKNNNPVVISSTNLLVKNRLLDSFNY